MFFPLALIGVGKDTQAATRAPHAQTDTNIAATAVVTAVGFLRVGCTEQQQITRRIQRGIATRFKLAACNQDIAAVRRAAFSGRIDGQIIARRQGRTTHTGLFLMLLRGRFL
ncbi:Uncharacterised protein [Yersinia intermedia]|nr:Uncharacterised protein [Yersinia intermedia]CRY84479.1 Uncharacterised protein [Yersinia intermedia]